MTTLEVILHSLFAKAIGGDCRAYKVFSQLAAWAKRNFEKVAEKKTDGMG